MFKRFAGISVILVVFNMLIGLAFGGGLIYVAFWCLKHSGVI